MDVRTSAGVKVPHAEFFPPPPSPRGPSVWLSRLAEDRRELVRFWPVVQNMVVQELKVRYQRSFLGFVWTLLNPLLMLATLGFVFSHLFKTIEQLPALPVRGDGALELPERQPRATARCAIIMNEGLIRKIYLPKLIFPLARVLIALVTFVFSLGGDVPAALAAGRPAVVGDAGLAGGARASSAIFTLGLSLIVATANTFYRDCGHLISVFLQAWYFLTPIIYPVDGRLPRACAVDVPAQSGVLFHRDVPRHLVLGAMAPTGPGGGGGGDRGGHPGSRLCHIQVARRQDGLPTLIGAAPGRTTPARPRPR